MERSPCKTDKPCEDKQKVIQDETEIVLKFARQVVGILSKVTTLKDTLINNHLKVSQENRERIVFSVPRYMNNLGVYAVNRFLAEETKIVRICDFANENRSYYSPTYSNIEIARNKIETLLTEGWAFVIYKKTPIIVYFEFCCSNPKATFTFNKKDRNLVSVMVKEIDDFMKHNNFFKNEKLKLTSGFFLSFLEYSTLNWDDLVINDELKDSLMLNLVFPINNKELCKKFDLAWRRGILLGGEPGTGKTKFAKILCSLLTNCTVIWVTAEGIDEAYHVKLLFEAARNLAPSVIILEDLDFFGRDRELIHSPILGELLNQLDGNAPNEGVFILASSNRPGLLDKALANRPGRFDVRLEFNLPDIKERIKMLELFSKNKPLAEDIDFKVIADATSNFTGAQIQETFIHASLDCLNKGRDKITQGLLLQSIKKIRENNRIENEMVR